MRISCKVCKAPNDLPADFRGSASCHACRAPLAFAAAPRSFEMRDSISDRSEMFSLEQLVREAEHRHESSVPPAPDKKRDSGMIDLFAVQKQAREAEARAKEVAERRRASDPPRAFVRDTHGELEAMRGGSQRRKGLLLLGAGAGLLSIVGLAFALTSGAEEAPKPSTTAAVPTQVAPAPEPTPEPVAATATSTEEEAAAPAPAPSGATKASRRGASRGAKRSSGPKLTKVSSSGVDPGATKAKAVPKAASDPCHCKGDFKCAMACTAR